ncbi:MAG: PP0621 family protein [Gammaproteobacteria bacterium]|nr:PP0621 family protein [Gammaproteobacteria bacterium]
MPGFRLVLIVGAIVAIIMIVRRLMSSNKRVSTSSQKELDADQVVSCSRCGVHVPEKEMVERNGRQICRECDHS